MKKYLHCLISLISISAFAQNFQGIAVYESKTSFDFDKTETNKETKGNKLSPEIDAEIKEQLKKAFEKTYTLQFDKVASLYKEEEKLDKPSAGNINISINFNGGGTQYKNLKEKTSITETEFFGKEFLITDSLHKTDWKLENETKKIGNYTCYKATATIKPVPKPETNKTIAITDTAQKDIIITAWYTPEIPVSHGPGNYCGLPGLILEVNDGRTSMLCSKITLNPKEKFEIKAPKKGSKVSREEYNEIVNEKTKEMMEMNDGSLAPGTSERVIRIGG